MLRQPTSPFTPHERELMLHFGQEPDLANGPQKGQPKIPKAIQSMLDRGLVRIGTNPMGRPAAFFTESRLQGLRQLLQESRAMDRCGTGICGENSGWVIRQPTKDEMAKHGLLPTLGLVQSTGHLEPMCKARRSTAASCDGECWQVDATVQFGNQGSAGLRQRMPHLLRAIRAPAN